MKKILLATVLLGSSLAQAMPTVGSSVMGEIVQSTHAGNVVVPLPSGSWTIVYEGQFDGPRMQRAGLDVTGYFGEASNQFEELVLIQADGNTLKSILEIKYNITNDLKTYSDNLCSNQPMYFRDNYGTKFWNQRCLEINITGDSIASDVSLKAQRVRSYVASKHMVLPGTWIAMEYGQYDRDGKRVDVKLFDNRPIQEGMTQYVDFAKRYAEDISSKFR